MIGASPAGALLPGWFKSLADDRQAGAIGVILSGTGWDGTLGVEEIKAAGGITFAQDEASSRYPSMPRNAVRSGCVDMVLPPAEIAVVLARIGQNPLVTVKNPPQATPLQWQWSGGCLPEGFQPVRGFLATS